MAQYLEGSLIHWTVGTPYYRENKHAPVLIMLRVCHKTRCVYCAWRDFFCVRAEIEALHETRSIVTPAEGVTYTHDTQKEPMTIVVGMWTRTGTP